MARHKKKKKTAKKNSKTDAVFETLKDTVMIIENEWGEVGTGFLVRRNIIKEGKKMYKVFLVTNKHVINKDPKKRKKAKEIKIHYNERKPDKSIGKADVTLALVYIGGKTKNWIEHPDKDVDVLVIDFTPLVGYFEKTLVVKWHTYDTLATKLHLKKVNITIGDEVLITGYPLGLRHKFTNYPLLTRGSIATRIGEPLDIAIKENGVWRNRVIRGFIVDGGAYPGSSGSPVYLNPVQTLPTKKSQEKRLTYALGIISEAQFRGPFTGLTIVFDSETIIETIELFLKKVEKII